MRSSSAGFPLFSIGCRACVFVRVRLCVSKYHITQNELLYIYYFVCSLQPNAPEGRTIWFFLFHFVKMIYKIWWSNLILFPFILRSSPFLLPPSTTSVFHITRKDNPNEKNQKYAHFSPIPSCSYSTVQCEYNISTPHPHILNIIHTRRR